MLQKDKPPGHNKPIVDKHDGVLESLVLLDFVKYTRQQGTKTIILDSVLQLILNEYEKFCTNLEQDYEDVKFAEKTDEISLAIENLVKDL